ncbi:hypothetical protein BRADI_2g40510v3 [Brachypodium distachyon]|uniref:RNase H type-1 domain-containing protein n=1 Tax=Brachypodium distachyon TaxID=15368 RepID=A0A2K2DD04_BRADI|nr:hypothetical protein BRADI_2g40510v3 [Brachypodium distachyon]
MVKLGHMSAMQREAMLLIWWRAWHLWNDQVFKKGDATIKDSVLFLLGFRESHDQLATGTPCLSSKGKETLLTAPAVATPAVVKPTVIWTPPPAGWLKLNVHAAFSSDTRAAFWGGVLRDHFGKVVAWANGPLLPCGDALMAEARACLTGLRSLIHLIDKPVAWFMNSPECSWGLSWNKFDVFLRLTARL